VQTLLSEHWHAVRYLRPRLREGVQPLHRLLRGKPWVLLFDPVTQRFHRMAPRVWRIVQLLDGRRTLDEVWNTACDKANSGDAFGARDEETISQHELVQLISSLHSNDLLQTQVSPDASEILERHRRQHRAKLKQSLFNPMSIKVPLWYPDAWFERQAGFAPLLFSWPVLMLWLLVTMPAGVLAWQHWAALTDNISDRVLTASNVVLLWFTYPIVKAIHEWAHGIAIKAWGGQVREVGVIFIFFTPVPYVDATSSYRFPSKWTRAAVSAAGILAELFLGALAVYVWVMAESGLVTAIAFNVILIAGVSTLLVNGNPLMRYDGYFIASDLLEMPNLGQQAVQYWAYLVDRYVFGAREAQSSAESRSERVILLVYGAVSPIYRLLVIVGLVWFVAAEYLLVGAVMALMMVWSAFVMPLWKGWKHLTESAALARRREVAMRRTVAALLLVFLFAVAVPLPFRSVEQGVVWLPDEAIVRAEVAGHVVHSDVIKGEQVQAQQMLLRLDNMPLQAELGTAAATVAQVQAQLRKAQVDDPLRAAALRLDLAARQAQLDEAVRRDMALQVKASTEGRWEPAVPTELTGRYARRGEVLGYVVNGPSRLVRVAATQEENALIHSRLRGVQVRLSNSPQVALTARVRRWVPGGELDLVSPALGTSGGGQIPVDPSQQGGTRSLKRVFDLEVELENVSPAAVFGDRAYVRFDLKPAPLAWQWFLRLRQVFLAHLNV
jgi:putative peptide zinc metalloprotease protein